MKLENTMKLSNRFKLQVVENGQVVHETPWKNNMILNQGKDAVASVLTANLFVACAIGTGTSTVVATQTGLDNEIVRSNTYLTGTGNCGTAVALGTELGHIRTYDFPPEITSITYSEVGWSHILTAGNNLNTRALFFTPITVGIGQSLRVIYAFTVAVTPTTQRALTAPITGWPSLQYTLTAVGDGTGAGSSLSQPTGGETTMTSGETFTVINAGTSGLTNGTTYYVGALLSSQFRVAATSGGAAIGFHNGSVVVVLNATGNEQRILLGLSAVNLDGTTNATGFDAAGVCFEPSVDANYIALSPFVGVIPAFNTPLSGTISANAFAKQYALQAYTAGNYFRDKQVVFLPSDGGSNRNDWRWIFMIPTATAWTTAGYAFRFTHLMQKLNTATLTVAIRASWS